MLAASLAGVAHNAVRSNGVQLIAKVPKVQGEVERAAEAGGSGPTTESTSNPGAPDGTVTVERMKELFDAGEVYVLDARDPSAFEEARISGSINIPYDQLPNYYNQLMETVPMDATVVCYCWSPTCDFSDQLATELRLMGFENVLVFTGGWEHWETAGHPREGTKAE